MGHDHGETGGAFEKRRPHGDSSLLLEAAGLRWLAEAEPQGGIHAVRVLRATDDALAEERVVGGRPNAAAARAIGAALARTHAAGAPWFGCPPAGWPPGDDAPFPDESRGRGLWVGRARTPLVPRERAAGTWGAFFSEHRIMYYVRLLRDEGTLPPGGTRLLERVASRVADGTFDAPEPRLVEEAMARDPEVACARLHGDLWAGNVLWLRDADGATRGGALIDPMACGGYAETDLAMLALFGYPHLEDVLAGYDEASPLADGWRERVGLHQLAPLLLHCVLFGEGYVGATLATARRYS